VGLGLELLEHRRPVEEAGRREEKGGGRVGPAHEGGRGIFPLAAARSMGMSAPSSQAPSGPNELGFRFFFFF
jgi:hypothetical protein